MEKIAVGLELTRRWRDPPIVLAVGLIVGIPSFIAITILLAVYVHILAFPVPALVLWFFYNYIYMRTPSAPTDNFVIFKDKSLGRKFGKRKIPVCILYEAFIREQVDFKKDVYLTLLEREQFICYRPSFTLLKFLVLQVFPSTSSSFHNKKADEKEIKLHYDRGNDFFAGFLGPSMIYTSPVYHGLQQSLEEAQANKCSLVCSKLQVGMGKTMLDIGCGWGTLARHAAKKFFAKSTGVTLSKEQHQWCEQKAKEEGLESSVTFLHRDYRDIPLNAPYDAISAIEMAEHVGIRNFQAFLARVSQLLKDDGLFLMQVSGLRKGSDWEDIMWGLFMSKYIFPGADASTPLNWYVKQMEQAGFEIRSVETIGKHYSHGIMQWYRNWESNKASLVGKYGEPLCRLWSFFLAWSVIASGQGTATCFQILAHKNLSSFNRDVFTSQDTHVGIYSKDSKF